MPVEDRVNTIGMLRIDRRRFGRQIWPNATKYAKMCEKFSQRKLTYASDAPKAFSAITQSFTPSFPGGFFYAMPEFLFDLALLWTFAAPENVRRETLPSWSWIAWEGTGGGYEGIHFEPAFRDCWNPVCRHDEDRICRWPMNVWRKRDPVTGKMETINNTYHLWLNAEEDGVSNLPGWKSPQQPENCTLQELGFTEGRVSHPFPLASKSLLSPFPSPTWEPFLYAQVRVATFRFAGHPNSIWGTVGLMDSTGKRVGNLRGHDSGTTIWSYEALGTTGRECCLMAVCEATIPRWSRKIGNLHYETGNHEYGQNNLGHPPATFGMPFKWVDVLWVEWKGRIAYRRGVGQVWLDAWQRASTKQVDTILG